jgi:hypothetical protein
MPTRAATRPGLQPLIDHLREWLRPRRRPHRVRWSDRGRLVRRLARRGEELVTACLLMLAGPVDLDELERWARIGWEHRRGVTVPYGGPIANPTSRARAGPVHIPRGARLDDRRRQTATPVNRPGSSAVYDKWGGSASRGGPAGTPAGEPFGAGRSTARKDLWLIAASLQLGGTQIVWCRTAYSVVYTVNILVGTVRSRSAKSRGCLVMSLDTSQWRTREVTGKHDPPAAGPEPDRGVVDATGDTLGVLEQSGRPGQRVRLVSAGGPSLPMWCACGS